MSEYKILDKVRQLENVLHAELLTDEFKKSILMYEMKRVEELIPFINKGMEEALAMDEAIVIVKHNREDTKKVEYSSESSFTLRNESGDIIGEIINDEEELEDLKNDPNAYFISDNFVTYQNLTKPGEKQFFVLESEKCGFITDEDLDSLVSELKVAIPSTETDHFIKDHFNVTREENIGTFIIGFNV